MRALMIWVSAVSLLGATAAHAFQEQQAGAKGAPGAALSEAVKPEAGGTVVAIPGLGKLGVIPKLDFGLELLYGDDTQKLQMRDDRQTTTVRPEADEDGLRIRGSIKHRF